MVSTSVETSGTRMGAPRRLNLLVVAPGIPRPNWHGVDMRIYNLMQIMARRHRVDVCSLYVSETPEVEPQKAKWLRDDGVRVLPGHWHFGIEQALGRRVYDAVFFEFWFIAEQGIDLVRRHQPWARIVIDSLDLNFRRNEAAVALGVRDHDPSALLAIKERELSVYRKADFLVCISSDEHRVLEAEGGIQQLLTIPLIIPERARSVRPRAPELVFVGVFDYPPNRDGLVWFVREVWPIVRQRVPEARLTAIGNKVREIAPEDLADLEAAPGVELTGYVPDLAPYLDRASAMIAPLRFGAGMKTKVVEGMMAGLPVVTTSFGIQGLAVVPGEHLLVADESEAMADRVVELLADPARAERIGRDARDFAASLCSERVIAEHVDDLFHRLAPRRPIVPPAGWMVHAARNRALRARGQLGRLIRGNGLQIPRREVNGAGMRGAVPAPLETP